MKVQRTALAGIAAVLALSVVACGEDGGSGSNSGSTDSKLAGQIRGDGSSTVFPIMEAVAEEFGKENPDVKVEVGSSGTGGGFEKFCKGETDFSNASRPIKDEEKAACATGKVDFVEFRVAFDGLSIVTNKDMKIDCLTVDELKKLWIAGSSVKKYSDIKAGLPGKDVKLYGPGSDSGTYDYFLEEILGKDSKFRDDFTPSENDNELVSGVKDTADALGYFGYSYYEQNKGQLNLVKVDGGKGCIAPSTETIRDGSYDPLSRPLYVYVRKDKLAKPEVKALFEYILTDARELITEVGYVELEDADYDTELGKLG